MQLSKEEYARKRIHNGFSMQVENSVTRVTLTVRHHSASQVMPNSYPRDGIVNPHLTTINDSYMHIVSVLFFSGNGGLSIDVYDVVKTSMASSVFNLLW